MSKAVARWRAEGNYDRYITGDILDIGCGDDKISPEADGWDAPDGDAQKLATIENNTYDTVVSAHTIEHVRDPHEALFNWWRVLKPGGHLVFLAPDEDTYEQGMCPSKFNPDHKHTFTISKEHSWSPRSLNVTSLLERLPHRRAVSIRTIDTGYTYSLVGSDVDQTLGDAEAAIEVVVQKLAKQHGLRTSYKTLLTCEMCGRHSLLLNGITQEDRIEARCGGCGWMGEI